VIACSMCRVAMTSTLGRQPSRGYPRSLGVPDGAANGLASGVRAPRIEAIAAGASDARGLRLDLLD
jgi:hypothetical protein